MLCVPERGNGTEPPGVPSTFSLGVHWLTLLFFLIPLAFKCEHPWCWFQRETKRRCLCLPDSSTYRNASCLHFWQPLVDLDDGQQLATQPLWVFNQQYSECTCAVKAYPNPTCPLYTTIAKSPSWPLMSSKALVYFPGRLQSGFTALKRLGDQGLT